MSEIANVARKLRRALRNQTGVQLTLGEIRAVAVIGALDLVTKAENDELTREYRDSLAALEQSSNSVAQKQVEASSDRPPLTPAAMRALVSGMPARRRR